MASSHRFCRTVLPVRLVRKGNRLSRLGKLADLPSSIPSWHRFSGGSRSRSRSDSRRRAGLDRCQPRYYSGKEDPHQPRAPPRGPSAERATRPRTEGLRAREDGHPSLLPRCHSATSSLHRDPCAGGPCNHPGRRRWRAQRRREKVRGPSFPVSAPAGICCRRPAHPRPRWHSGATLFAAALLGAAGVSPRPWRRAGHPCGGEGPVRQVLPALPRGRRQGRGERRRGRARFHPRLLAAGA
jgi:hypothetical protein